MTQKERKNKNGFAVSRFWSFVYHPFRRGFDFLGDRHITINPMRKGRCTNPDCDDYERAVAESSLLDLIKAYRSPIYYWNSLTREQKRAYGDDFSVFRKHYRKSVIWGMLVILAALLLVVAFLSWMTYRVSMDMLADGNYSGF